MLKRADTGNTPLYLALDGGTGSCRAILFDANGREIAIGQHEWNHPETPGVPGGMDFDVAANGTLFDEIIAEVIADIEGKVERIKAISTTSMREGFVVYDAEDRAIWACPNIDGRAGAEAAELTADGSSDRIFDLAGDWVSITAPSRFKWIAKHQPQLMERARKFGMLSDWIATRLTGEYATEPSCGSSSAMFDLNKRNWSAEICDIIGIDPDICPTVVEASEQIGTVTKNAARRTGLLEGTPVIAGGADTQLALVGLARAAEQATLVGGSFWQMTTITNQPVIDRKRRARTLCHAIPDQWMIEGIGFLTGFSLRWFRDAFCELEMREAKELNRSAFELMEEKAALIAPGADGLQAIFSSVMQSDGWIHGPPSFIQFDINRPDLSNRIACIRALMESGAFVSQLHREIITDATNLNFDSAIFTGGSAQGQLWPQIIADTMNIPVKIPTVKETTALGAAILAAIGVGTFSSLDEARQMASGIERVVEPEAENHAIYIEKSAKWRKLDEAMVNLAQDKLAEPMWQAAGGVKT